MLMNKKAVLGACLVGAISLLVYICALLLGVNYDELFGVTIIQIAYIVVLSVYGTVVLIKKAKEETAMEKVPIRIEKNNEEDEYREC